MFKLPRCPCRAISILRIAPAFLPPQHLPGARALNVGSCESNILVPETLWKASPGMKRAGGQPTVFAFLFVAVVLLKSATLAGAQALHADPGRPGLLP